MGAVLVKISSQRLRALDTVLALIRKGRIKPGDETPAVSRCEAMLRRFRSIDRIQRNRDRHQSEWIDIGGEG